MTPAARTGAPRRLVIAFVLVLVVPAVAVVWLGVGALRDDRARSVDEAGERLQFIATQTAAALDRAIAATELRLSAAPDTLNPDADSLVMVWPVTMIAEPEAAFASGDRLEFHRRDLPAALSSYRELTTVADPAVRAGALLRLARVQRRLGDRSAALTTLTALERLPQVRTAGIPADLMARLARLDLLAQSRSNEARTHAAALAADLDRGRWPLHPDTRRHYIGVVSAFDAPDTQAAHESSREAILSAAWRRFSEPVTASTTTDGRELIQAPSGAFVLLWRHAGDRLVALAASPTYQAREWFTQVPAVDDARAQVALTTSEGRLVWGPAPGPNHATERRVSAAGSVNWVAVAREVTPGALTIDTGPRRRVLIAALVLVVGVTLAGGYVVSRAVSRELAAARLQADFVAAVSHEFRTPLTSLRQFTDLLNTVPEPDEAKRRAFHQAQARATDRLQRLVESLLDFGRMEAGARPYDRAPVAVTPWVRAVVEEFRRDALPADFVLDATVPEQTGTIAGDRDALAFSVWNLLDNAVKYSGDGRSIALDVVEREEGVRIAVRDEGLGIPASEQRRVFEKFVRGAASHRLGIRGTGLGLALVSRIVAAHGGRIELVSAEGRGSTFTMVLPRSARPAETDASVLAGAVSIDGAHSHR